MCYTQACLFVHKKYDFLDSLACLRVSLLRTGKAACKTTTALKLSGRRLGMTCTCIAGIFGKHSICLRINKIVAVHSQDNIRTCKPHAVLAVHCNYYAYIYMYIVVAVHSQDSMKLACANVALAVHCCWMFLMYEQYVVIQNWLLVLYERFIHGCCLGTSNKYTYTCMIA